MTANLLTLNSSKTECLLIGLKQQLAKIQKCPLSTTHSARNLGFIFDEHLSFSDQITLHFPSPTTSTFVNSVVSAHSLISKQPAPLPLYRSLQTRLLQLTTISPTHSYPDFNTSKTLSLVQLLKLPSSLVSLLLSNLSTG